MSRDALLQCFKCGATLPNVLPDTDNHPQGGTEFATYGHYGSTFWDSFDGEELVLNICDGCLNAHLGRLGQRKRFLPVKCEGTEVGKQWVDRPIVLYTGNTDDGFVTVELEELGTEIKGIEWADNIEELKEWLEAEEETVTDDVPHYLSRSEVATHLGLAGVKSLSRVILPPPDVYVGVHKGWKESTIDTWNASRPGPGWWGPRPVKEQAS